MSITPRDQHFRMADSFNKREQEKRRQQKQEEKERRKAERKANLSLITISQPTRPT